MSHPNLTEKQQLAVDGFLAGKTKTQAMLDAGYSKKTAKFEQSLFKRPDVKAYLERRQKRLAKKFDLSQERIVAKYMQIAFGDEVLARFKKVDEDDGSLYWDFTGATEEDLQLVQEMSTEIYQDGRGPGARKIKKFKVTAADQMRALDALARHLGMFNDKVTVQGELTLVDRILAGRKRAGVG
jgi:phage terminase small subunit